MEIRIHGYKLEGKTYEITLNWNRKPTEVGINGSKIDDLKAMDGRTMILRYEDGAWTIPPKNETEEKIIADCIAMFG